MNERKRRLEHKITTLESAIVNAKIVTSDSTIENIIEKSRGISCELVHAISKRAKYSDTDKPYNIGTAYSKEIKEFALSLHNVSPAGYRYVREALDNILPSESTIIRWMRKVDGSPGFSDQVM